MRIVDLSVDLGDFHVDNHHRIFTVYTDASNGTKFSVRGRQQPHINFSAGMVFLIPPEDCIPPGSIQWVGRNLVADFPYSCFWDMCVCLPHPDVEDRRDLLVMLHLIGKQIVKKGRE